MDYVDKGERLLVGDDKDHMWFLDAETLRPSGPAFAVAAHCCAAGAPDGGTAMVFEQSNGWRQGNVAAHRHRIRKGAQRRNP